MSSPVLVVDAVTHTIGSRAILQEVSFDAARGSLVVLAGRSGSGKTTLLHVIAGITVPTSGRVVRPGDGSSAAPDWATLSLTPQHSAVAPGLTVRENVLLPAALRGAPDDRGLIAALGLSEIADRLAGQTSLGEQQRAAIGRGLVLRPAVACLDEPTSHQDDDHVAALLRVLLATRDAGTALVVATHDARVVDVADQVVRMADGRVDGVEQRRTSTSRGR